MSQPATHPAALVGRDRELGFLQEFFQQTAVSGGALFLSGDPGVGKTALVNVLAGSTSAAGTMVVRVAGAEFELSPGAAGRGRGLAQAAYIGAETIGEMKDTQQLLEAMRQAGAQASDPLYYLPAATFVMLNGDGHIDTIHRLLVGAIEGGHHGYDASDATLVNAMWSLGLVSWSGGRAELWEPFLALMNRLSPQPPALLALNIDMWANPVRTGMAALPRLDAALRAVQREVDPHVIENLTASAIYADRLADFREPLWRMVQRGR